MSKAPFCPPHASMSGVSQEGGVSVLKSPSKATVITDEIDSEIENFCFLWRDRCNDESVPDARVSV